MTDSAKLVMTFAISLVFVAAFYVVHLPLPWLLGPMIGCLIAALVGLPLRGAPTASTVMRTILGVAVGTSITPALFGRLGDMALTLAIMPLLVGVIGLVGYPFFRRLFGFDHATSFYSAMPGGLQDMLVFGEEAGGDVRAIGLIHATRVLVIVTVLPILFSYGLGVDLSRPPGQPIWSIPYSQLALMVFVAIAGWKLAARIGLFGASVLGPMILAAIFSLAGIIEYRPPAAAIYAAQFFIGFTVGVKYAGITWPELRKDVLAGVCYTLIIIVIASAFAAAAISLGLVPFVEGMLAFSPGGQAEMAIVALVAGADMGFVVVHHIVRVVLVIAIAPIVARAMTR